VSIVIDFSEFSYLWV